MATINYRVKKPQAFVINGVNAGGAMQARISEGYDAVIKSAPDGIGGPPLKDREIQFCRGTIISQDWIEAVALLTGTLGTLVFYERISGVAETAGYIKHTITAPVIHRFTINVTKGGYATVSFDFECRAADPTKTITDMHAMTDAQTAPTYVPAARGAFRVKTTLHGAANIYHVTAFSFSIAMTIAKACNDGDIAYTAVDVELDNMACSGSLTFQDGKITSAKLTAQSLLLAAAANLVLTVTQAQGATGKTITVANVEFNSADNASDVNADFTEYTASFDVANIATLPLSLAGTTKIIAIADAA
jgi:hypothetical protein